jgi:hypothetical protein
VTTCNGYCPTGEDDDCPELTWSPGLTDADYDSYGQECFSNICDYYFYTDASLYFDWEVYGEIAFPLVFEFEEVDFVNMFIGDAAQPCMDFVSDADPRKKCYVPTLMIFDLDPACVFQFGCTSINKGSSTLDIDSLGTTSLTTTAILSVLENDSNNTNSTSVIVPMPSRSMELRINEVIQAGASDVAKKLIQRWGPSLQNHRKKKRALEEAAGKKKPSGSTAASSSSSSENKNHSAPHRNDDTNNHAYSSARALTKEKQREVKQKLLHSRNRRNPSDSSARIRQRGNHGTSATASSKKGKKTSP